VIPVTEPWMHDRATAPLVLSRAKAPGDRMRGLSARAHRQRRVVEGLRQLPRASRSLRLPKARYATDGEG
jgi:hypothetical protein